MNWKLEFLPEVEKDFRQLSGDQRILVRTESEMLIVVVGARADDEVYETAEQRVKKYGY
jgi:mRNA-degrading endonuclease RelE of RelBE toxin-antitoxin system